jgi:Glycine cleavage H-protein
VTACDQVEQPKQSVTDTLVRPDTVTSMNVPAELLYSVEHEWARPLDDRSSVRIGITDYAQDALGDVVFVDLPEVGARVAASDSVGELESTKSVSRNCSTKIPTARAGCA